MAKQYKMTEEDKQYFLRLGYEKTRLGNIQKCLNAVRLDLTNGYGTEKITPQDAIKVLGREKFLSGVDRAMGHMTATRVSDIYTGLGVSFSLAHLF